MGFGNTDHFREVTNMVIIFQMMGKMILLHTHLKHLRIASLVVIYLHIFETR